MALLPPDNDGSAEFNLRISVFLKTLSQAIGESIGEIHRQYAG